MAYKPEPASGPVRDKVYPSQIAAERPMMATRIHCAEQPQIEDTLRGGEQPMHTESACDKFNRELRSGIGTGRPDFDSE
jgi:hypothetical protein